jgi:hypothetical protein
MPDEERADRPLVVVPKEAARLIHRRASDVYAAIHSGDLRAIRRNSRFLIPMVELQRFVLDELDGADRADT